ncbi:MAG: sensor histidine kinase [Thermaurantiacus sp.]
MSIRRTLLGILLIALLPLAVLAVVQGAARNTAEREMRSAQAMRSAALAAEAQRSAIAAADGLLLALAGNPTVFGPGCTPVLAEVQKGFPGTSNLSVIDGSGTIICSALPAPGGLRIDSQRWWPDLVSSPGLMLAGPLWGTVSERRVLWALRPVRDPTGSFTGAIGASLDLGRIAGALERQTGDTGARLLLVNPRGRVIAASHPGSFGRIALAQPGGTTSFRDNDGQGWTVAVEPVPVLNASGADLRLVYAIPEPPMFGRSWWLSVGGFLLPALVLLFAAAAIWIGTNRAILRWISDLRGLAGEYAEGSYRAPLDGFRSAPREVRDLAASLGQMARTIDARDRDLRGALSQQEALSRELHHRVRNNLQMLASYLSLAERRVEPGPGRVALADARVRVAAIALMHRLLYDSGDLASLPARGLLQELCTLLERQGALAGQFHLDCAADVPDLGIDTAVPMALWLIEAASALADAARPDATRINIDLVADAPGAMRLLATAPVLATPRSTLLMDAIARQLAGTLQAVSQDDGFKGFELRFGATPAKFSFTSETKEQAPRREVQPASTQ